MFLIAIGIFYDYMAGKNPLLAAGLNLLVAGLGQIYLGRWARGLAFLALDFATGYYYMKVDEGVGAVLNLVVGVVAVVDAYRICKAGEKPKKPPEADGPPLRVF